MTETPEGVVVTQEARNAAADAGRAASRLTSRDAEEIRAGKWDDWGDVQAFARFQAQVLAHTPTLRGEEVERLRAELAWYGEQARLARLIHSGGDAGRHALSEDGGKRALAALSQPLAVDTGQSGEDDEFATVEAWEHDDQRELSLLYNHRADDSLQFNRGQMREAIRHGRRLAATPAPSVSPDPAGEVHKAWQRVSDALDGIEGGMHAELEDAASAMWPLVDALASSPIPKTFPREAVARIANPGSWWSRDPAAEPLKWPSELQRSEGYSRADAIAALLQKERQS